MKPTDDFLADLETQLGAAAAGRLRRRRRTPRVLLKPALVAAFAAVAVTAFVLAVGSGVEQERAADPPARRGAALITLPAAAHESECGLEERVGSAPPPELVQRFGVLRAPRTSDDRLPRGVRAPGLEAHVRSVVAGPPAWLVPSDRVAVSGCGGDRGAPGVCLVVDLRGIRTACFTLEQIEAGRAAASLGPSAPGSVGLMVVVVPDGVDQVTTVPELTKLSTTTAVTDNVVLADTNGVEPGMTVRVEAAPAAGCSDLAVEDGVMPDQLTRAVPALARGAGVQAPDAVTEVLRRAGAGHAWLADARWIPARAGGGVGAWLVAVRDSRFAACRHPLLDAPDDFEGAGACIVAVQEDEPFGVLCAGVDEIREGPIEVFGGRVVLGLPPQGVSGAGGRVDGAITNVGLRGAVLVHELPPGAEVESFEWTAADAPSIVVLNATTIDGLARAIGDRIERATGLEPARTGTYVDQTRAATVILAAPGHRGTAEAIRRALDVPTVEPLASEARDDIEPDADVVVIVGPDMAP